MYVKDTYALSFDDVLLEPRKFSGKSRKDIDISTDLLGLRLNVPLISANMPSITEQGMACEMWKVGGLGIYHRMTEFQDDDIRNLKNMCPGVVVGASVGIDHKAKNLTKKLLDAGADLICVEVAHAHQDQALRTISVLTNEYKEVKFVIGNIATRQAGEDILDACCNPKNVALKVGVGGGAVCLTRVAAGAGCPTFQSILNCNDLGVPIIADGGIKTSGDAVKALGAGAAACMVGSLLAGTEETPGSVIKDKNGDKFKVYRGSASYGTKRDAGTGVRFVEGAETLVKFKGPVSEQIKRLSDGIKSGFSYGGALNLKELQEKSAFLKVTPSGHKESLPHGLLF